MKRIMLFLTALLLSSALSALDTDVKKFFDQGPLTGDIKLPQDKVYPAGRLFPFGFYSTGGGRDAKQDIRLPLSRKELDQKEIADGVQFTVTLGAASGKVLAFYPAEPGPMKAENGVLDTGFTAGIQPVEITESGDYDGFYSAENGKLTLPCRGKFRCRCLTTGRTVDMQ